MIEILLYIYLAGSAYFTLYHMYQLKNNRFHEFNIFWFLIGLTLWPLIGVIFILSVLWDGITQ